LQTNSIYLSNYLFLNLISPKAEWLSKSWLGDRYLYFW